MREEREEEEGGVEYRDIVSVTMLYRLWHIVDRIFHNLDAVSLLNCEKVGEETRNSNVQPSVKY